MKNLVWLASYPKSGNTWVRALLTAYLTESAELFDFKSMDRFTVSESSYREYVVRSGKPREQLDAATIDALRKEVQQSLTTRREQPFWVKTHNANILHLGQRLIYPEFTRSAVYIVRNPLDVVDSLADSCGRTIDQGIDLLNDPRHALGGPNSVHVKQFLGTWSQHVRSWTTESRFPVHVIRYEDIHLQGFAVFGRLLQFLRWPFDEDRLQRALECTAFNKLQEVEERRGFAERNANSRSGRFFRRGESNAWQRVLTRHQAAAILAKHAQTMLTLGYEIPDLDAVYPRPVEAVPIQVGPRTN